MKKLLSRYTPLQIAMHIYAWSVIALLLFEFSTGTLSVNPIQELEQRTGRHAATLLVLSLACTPLNTIFGWRELLKRRRALGLYAFMYAVIHVIIFVDIDYGLAWSLILRTVFGKPYIIVGMTSFLLLTHCITVNVTLGSNVASGKMLLSDRLICLSEEQHDEPEKQARVIRSCATTLPES